LPRFKIRRKVEKLRTAKTPKEFLDCIDQQEQDQPQS